MPTKKEASAEPTDEAPNDVVIAYKGFDNRMQCRGFQFEVGKTYEHDGDVKACSSGFHACENPLDVWNYYGPCDTRFARVELSGSLSRHGEDSKIAAARITVAAALSLQQFIADAVEFIQRSCSMAEPKIGGDVQSASWYSSQLAASGDSSKLAASGDSSKLAASGDYSQLAASGYSSQLAASGYSSKLAASGYSSKLAASGDSSIAMAASTNCAATAGERGCIVLTRWVESEKRFRVSVGYVGENIKAGVAYRLDHAGAFVEAA